MMVKLLNICRSDRISSFYIVCNWLLVCKTILLNSQILIDGFMNLLTEREGVTFRDGVERERRCGEKGISRDMTDFCIFFVGSSILFGFIYFQLFTRGQGVVGPGQ